jgi:hypothetical protein
MVGKRMVGTVTGFADGYFAIACPDAAPHLRDLFLNPRQMRGAQVGDRVTLEYQVTSSSGLWNVVGKV